MAPPNQFATKSAFELLSVDEPDYSSEEEDSPVSSAAPTTTPSKKAAARARAKLRKKGSSQTLAEQAQAALSSLPTAAEAKAAVVSQAGAAASQVQAAAATLPTAAQAKANIASAVKQANQASAKPVAQAKSAATQVKAAATSAANAASTVKVGGLSPAEAGAKAVKAATTAATAVSSAAKEAMPAEVPSINFPDGPSAYDDNGSSSDEGEPPVAYESEESDAEDDAPAVHKPPIPSSPSLAASAKPEAYTGADHDPGKKKAAIVTRTLWGLAMGAGAITICALGHIYVIALVFVIQAVVFGELTSLFDAGYAGEGAATGEGAAPVSRKRANRREERDRWSKRMAWYFFAATNYFLYGESLIYYFKHILTLRASFLPTAYSFAQHHRLISFGLYIIGFVSFVANLKRASLRRQFGLFGWIHMSLLLIVVSAHFIVNNILEGMIWFWVPASLVIFNDVAAYVCGMLFGRHQLIKLSPKKTVEGFVGAIAVTILLGVGWSTLFMKSNYMICPAQNLAASAFSNIQCTPNSAFVYRDFKLPESVITILENITSKPLTSIPWAPFQLHSVVLATFASLVAPFGGFFASGFKRAFNIKDFGDSIPGHGGMTDRMDCQFLMGLFTYVYYASLVRDSHVTVGSVMATVVTALTTAEQVELYGELARLLASKGVKAVGRA